MYTNMYKIYINLIIIVVVLNSHLLKFSFPVTIEKLDVVSIR